MFQKSKILTRIITKLSIIVPVLLFFTGLNVALGQSFILTGKVTTDSNEILAGCYIKVTTQKSSQILSYFNTGNKETFFAEIPFKKSDTFLITVTHIGFETEVISRFVNNPDTQFVNIKMKPRIDTLHGVVIKGPPVWVRGDTTFFNADAFKMGSETKLKDLITNMPGFEIDRNGNLLYNKKPVEKLLIEGEEIFADKIKLMLANFPVHVLSTVQAIENQTNDPLLKGLVNDNKVFVNLGLKNGKLKAAFGDGEAGIGTGKKYYFNPVIFSMYGKLKLGYIGNWDNIGNGIEEIEQEELKIETVKTAGSWMIPTNQLQLINDFENRRYITNGQFANHFQLNTGGNKRLRNTTEVHIVSDRQSQLTYNKSLLYDGTSFLERNDTNNIFNKPSIFTLKHAVTWHIDSTKNLDANLLFYHNGNRSERNTLYFQQGKSSSLDSKIANKWNSFTMSLNYTHRKTAVTAEKWNVSFSENHTPQVLWGYSEAYPSVFQLPDTGFQILHQQLNNTVSIGNAGWETIKNTKTGLLIAGVDLNSVSSSIGGNLYFTDRKDVPEVIIPDAYNNKGKLNITSLTGKIKRSVKLMKLPVSLDVRYGLSSVNRQEDVTTQYIKPVYQAGITTRAIASKRMVQSVSLSFSQKIAEPYQWYSLLLPNSISSFHQYLNSGQPLRELKSTYIITFGKVTPKSSYSYSLLLGINRHFSDFMSLIKLDNFISFSADSLIKNANSDYFISLNTNINSIDNRVLNYISAGANSNRTFIFNGGNSLIIRNFLYYLHTGTQIKYGKYYLNFRNSAFLNVARLPSSLKAGVEKNVFNVLSSLSQRLAVTHNSNALVTAEWYNYNIFTQQKNSFVFVDAEYNFAIPKKHLSFIVRLQNLTNRKFYRSWDISPLSQNYYSVPLVGRNIFASVRYEL